MKLLFSLDYDNVFDPDFIVKEAFRLKFKFKLPLEIYKSSNNCYHIRSLNPIDMSLAFEILDASLCSTDYKNFAKRIKCFPIRTGEKKIYKDGKLMKVKPKPKKVLTLR